MDLQEELDTYLEAHWDEVLEDMASLVAIESVSDAEASSPGAPYGAGPRAALDRVLEIAAGYGFNVQDCDGHIGIIDLPGTLATQVGIIGHVDVVAAGTGWSTKPYALARKDGYLLGRGILDDKGPLLLALHAMRFWKQRSEASGSPLPYTIRLLVGTCEETTMDDVAYYLAHFDEPDFLFSPDGQFPVVYGEGGIAHGKLKSAPIENGQILELEGGQATNAVPGLASALVHANLEEGTYGPVRVTSVGEELYRVEATGTSAHASLPWEGDNAIGHLADFLFEHGVGTPDERDFLQLVQSISHNVDGSTIGIDCSDEHFGDLTVVPSMIGKEGDALFQWLDVRYPTVITGEQIERCVGGIVFAFGCTFVLAHDAAPFVMNPDSPQVHALLDAYCAVTGKQAAAVTSKGGTYARLFKHGVCFGPDHLDEQLPDWVGGLHGANEGVSEARMQEAFRIYALALENLMKCDL